MCSLFLAFSGKVSKINSGRTLFCIWSIIFDILKIPVGYISCKSEKLGTEIWGVKTDNKIQVSVSYMLKSNMLN